MKNQEQSIGLTTPKKPLGQVKREFPNVKGYTMGECPSCGKKVSNIADWICVGTRQYPCGQKLDWSE